MNDFSLDELVRIYREEKNSRELAEIPDDFYQSAGRYVSQLNFELKRSDSVKKELLHEELRSVVFMVQEIHFARVFKAMAKIAQGQIPALLMEGERYAFSEIRQSLEKLQADLVQPTLSGKVDLTAPQSITNVLVIVLSDFQEKIIGADMRSYGPFHKGEVASIPAPNADMLARHGFARKMSVKA
jgi:DNA replication initiation complex subunit (GINS family)